MNYETFEHEADVGVRGYGDSLTTAFENAALAMYSVIVDIASVRQLDERTIVVSAPDRELLLVEWLNALLALTDIERLVFSAFTVSIDENTLTGRARGERMNRLRHAPRVEVKGATYHMLRVTETDGRVVAQCVVDV